MSKTQDLNILIVGVARNVENVIENEIKRLASSFSEFNFVSFYIVESDSEDNSLKELERLSHVYPNLRYTTLGNLKNTYEERLERIAFCRNQYMEYLDFFTKSNKVDVICVADLDGVNENLNANAVASCFERDDWAVCCANQGGNYYDVFALRHQTWSPNDCWDYERELRENGMNPLKSRQIAVYSRQRRISAQENWIEVESAFGGIALYKSNFLIGLRYKSSFQGKLVCEHISINNAIRELGGKIFINPKFINFNWNQHNSSHFFLNRIKRRIKYIIGVMVPSWMDNFFPIFNNSRS